MAVAKILSNFVSCQLLTDIHQIVFDQSGSSIENYNRFGWASSKQSYKTGKKTVIF